MTSSGLPPFTKPFDDIGSGLNLASFDLAGAERQDFQQRHGLLRLLATFDVLYDHLGFAVPGDEQWFSLFPPAARDLCSMRLEIADRFDTCSARVCSRRFQGRYEPVQAGVDEKGFRFLLLASRCRFPSFLKSGRIL